MITTMINAFTALLVGFVLVSSTACSQSKNTVDVQAAQKMIQKDAPVVLDVRTPEEFAQGHLVNATLANVQDASFESIVSKLDKKKPVVVYCASGKRSQRAAGMLQEMGFANVYNMAGGYNAWSAAGYKTTR